jgi:zinc protease
MELLLRAIHPVVHLLIGVCGLSLGAGIARASGPDGSADSEGINTCFAEVEHGYSAADQQAGAPLYGTLHNGLRVLVLPTSDAGVVSVQTWISVGSGSEIERGTTGYAHFFEHLMFHGTPTLGRVAREQRLVEMGVEENAWTSQDETCYHLLASAAHLDELIAIEADRFANLSLSAEGVRREAGAVYGEFRKSRANPDERLWDALWANAFEAHPYLHSTIGFEADIAAMPDGLDRALRFRGQHYRPDNALVVVAGDVNAIEALAMVEAHFGRWERPATPLALAPAPEPDQRRPRLQQIPWDGPEVEPKMMVGWRVPAFVPGKPQLAALDIVVELLTARDAGFYRALVDEQGLAWRVSGAKPRNADPGLLFMGFELRQGVVESDVVAALDAALAVLLEIDDAAVAAVAAQIRRQMIIGLADPESRAHALGIMALHGRSGTAFQDHVAAIQAVQAKDVKAVIQTLLIPSRRTIVSLGTGAEQ